MKKFFPFSNHPKALFLLVTVEMWSRFSYYGMRALLVLYMIKELHFSDAHAFGVYAVYCGLVELGGVVGGILGDRWLGQKRAIIIGGWLMALGHLLMAFKSSFFLALATIVLGSNLFSTNIMALLGQFYDKDAKREEGFTLFYMGINIGALIATILCGFLADLYGWHVGFGLAAIGMVVGNVTLHLFRSHLQGKGEGPPVKRSLKLIPLGLVMAVGMMVAIKFERFTMPYLPWIGVSFLVWIVMKMGRSKVLTKAQLVKLLVFLAMLTLFFAAEEQIGSSILVFSERLASTHLFGMHIPTSTILSINPLVIICCGTLATAVMRRSSLRFALPFLLGVIVFGGLALGCSLQRGVFPVGGVMGAIALLSFAELMVGPVVYSQFSKNAPKGKEGMVMGLVPIGFSFASLLGGFFSKLMAVDEGGMQVAQNMYERGFGLIALVLLGTGVIIIVMTRRSRNYEKSTVV